MPLPNEDIHGLRHDENHRHGRIIGTWDPAAARPPSPPSGGGGTVRTILLTVGALTVLSIVIGLVGAIGTGVRSALDRPEPGGGVHEQPLPGSVRLTAMTVGDCFDLAGAHDLDVVVPADCGREHFGQVLVRAELGTGPHSAVADRLSGGCAAMWPVAARRQIAAKELREHIRTPTAREWETGDRTIVCTAVIENYDRPLTGSLY